MRCPFLSGIGILITVASTAQANYCFRPLDVPGADYTMPRGINNSGDIVGYYVNAKGVHGFLYVGGSFTTIDSQGATWLNGINDSGDIVGYYMDVYGEVNSFLYVWTSSGSIWFPISIPDNPAFSHVWAYGISNFGHIVGCLVNATLTYVFLLYNAESSQGIWSGFGASGAKYTYAYGVNNSDDIVGYYLDATGAHGYGFLHAQRGFTSIDVPGASHTYPYGINDQGDIVGYYVNATGTYGFIAASNATLTVSQSGIGTGTVTSNPAGINCGSNCSDSYNCGTTVTLAATPAQGSVFSGWSGPYTGTGT